MGGSRQVALGGDIGALGDRQHSLDGKLAETGVGGGRVAAHELGVPVHLYVRTGKVGDNVVIHRLAAGARRGGEVAVVLPLEAEIVRGSIAVNACQLECTLREIAGYVDL